MLLNLSETRKCLQDIIVWLQKLDEEFQNLHPKLTKQLNSDEIQVNSFEIKPKNENPTFRRPSHPAVLLTRKGLLVINIQFLKKYPKFEKYQFVHRFSFSQKSVTLLFSEEKKDEESIKISRWKLGGGHFFIKEMKNYVNFEPGIKNCILEHELLADNVLEIRLPHEQKIFKKAIF